MRKFLFLSAVFVLSMSIVLHLNEKIKMRDGVELAAKVYFTASQMLKKNPCVLVRTPYGTSFSKDVLEDLTSAGYVVVVQDIRGMLDSKGTFSFFRNSGDDNIDTMKWIKTTHWASGDIGTIGFSAPGITQYMSLHGNPSKEVKDPVFQCVEAASGEAHKHIVYQGGALRHSLLSLWLKAIKQSWYYDVLVANEAFSDTFWGPLTNVDPSVVHWPSVHLGGWYDIFSQGILDMWNMYRKNPDGKEQYLVMTSGGHCAKSNFVFPHGEDYIQESYSYCPLLYHDKKPLKNLVNFYVINLGMNGTSSDLGNFWVSMKDFPENSTSRKYYPSSHVLETSYIPNTGNATFTYDPNDPTPTKGGNNLVIPCGPGDQIENEKRTDNIVFTSLALGEDLAIVGNIQVNLLVSTNQNDTDFVCRLSDVHPDRKSSLLLSDGIIRMKWRDDPTTPHLLNPGQKYEVKINLWSMAAIISKGHRLRLACTSSNYPRFSINGNSGKLLKDETKEDYVKAENTIYFGDRTFLSIPVVDMKVLQENKVDSILS